MPYIELSRALSDDGMPELAYAVLHAITDAIDRAKDETTVLTINGAPAALQHRLIGIQHDGQIHQISVGGSLTRDQPVSQAVEFTGNGIV